MIRIGILGDIGSGKSYVAQSFGYPVFNADEEVAKLYQKDRKIFNKLKKILPNYIYSFPIQKKEILNAKKAALSINIPASSWDCDQVNGCIDPGTGNGQYSSLAACNTACITDINENIANLSIYPNPTRESINVLIPHFNGVVSTELFDLIGNKLQTTNKTTISLEDYAKGIYILKVAYGDRVEEVKVIKE